MFKNLLITLIVSITINSLALAQSNCSRTVAGSDFIEVITPEGLKFKFHYDEGIAKIKFDSELPTDDTWKPYVLAQQETMTVRIAKKDSSNNSNAIANLFLKRISQNRLNFVAQVIDQKTGATKIIHNLSGGIICKTAETGVNLTNFSHFVPANARQENFEVWEDSAILAKLGLAA
ncbi:MAG TPA: hypothetical protein PKD37_07920 [Oligoflexia bacterium]|nr:hypothetical protein [Oligoflexia bacterium]HMP27889.1 hypothetical protein [Oligoflexia bacterium]